MPNTRVSPANLPQLTFMKHHRINKIPQLWPEMPSTRVSLANLPQLTFMKHHRINKIPQLWPEMPSTRVSLANLNQPAFYGTVTNVVSDTPKWHLSHYTLWGLSPHDVCRSWYICNLITFVAYDVCRLWLLSPIMTFFANYDVCHLHGSHSVHFYEKVNLESPK